MKRGLAGLVLVLALVPAWGAEVQILISATGGQEGDTLDRLTVPDLKLPNQPDAALAQTLATQALTNVQTQGSQTAANILWWVFKELPYLAKVRIERKDKGWEDGAVSYANALSGQRSEWQGDRRGFTLRQDWDDQGNLVVEERLDPQTGALVSHSDYSYREQQLTSKVELDAQRTEVYREAYQYDGLGLLRSIVRTDPKGRVQTSSYVYENGRLSELILEDGDAREFRVMDEHGRIIAEEEYQADKLTGLAWLTYPKEDTQKPEEKVWLSPATKEAFRERYTESGAVASLGSYTCEQTDLAVWQALTDEDRTAAFDALHLVTKVSYEYNQDDQTIARTEWKEGAVQRWEFDRTADAVTKERYFQDGALIQSTEYNGALAVTTAYRDGKAVNRLFERNGVRFKSQDLAGDKILRERLYD